MNWKGTELKTIGDYCKAMEAINTEEEGAEFMRLARENNPEHADSNIGYLTGYFASETAAKMRRLLRVEHPIFGTKTPTTKEAFQTGKWIGEKMRREMERGDKKPGGEG